MELLADIHPGVVHFPIAFLLLYPLMELLFIFTKKEFYSKVAFLFLIVGVVGALFAVLSGNQAYETFGNWQDESRMLFNKHQTYANSTIWFFTTLLGVRFYLHLKKKLNKVFAILLLLLSLFGSYFVYQAGSYGGKLAVEKTKISVSINKNAQ